MKDLSIIAALEDKDIVTNDVRSFVRPGIIFYPITNRFAFNPNFKRRPFILIGSATHLGGTEVYMGAEVSSNQNLFDVDIPIVIGGRVSFVSHLRVDCFYPDEVNKYKYFGTVDYFVLSMIKYTIAKTILPDITDPRIDERIAAYKKAIKDELDHGHLNYYRDENGATTPPPFKAASIYDQPDDEDDTPDDSHCVKTIKDDNQSFTPTVGDALSGLEFSHMNPAFQETVVPPKKPDVVITPSRTEPQPVKATPAPAPESVKKPEPVQKVEPKTEKTDTNAGRDYYVTSSDGKKHLTDRNMVSLRGKMLFVEDLYRTKTYSKFAVKFDVTGTTVKNRAILYIHDLTMAGVEVPPEIKEFVMTNKKKPANKPQPQVVQAKVVEPEPEKKEPEPPVVTATVVNTNQKPTKSYPQQRYKKKNKKGRRR